MCRNRTVRVDVCVVLRINLVEVPFRSLSPANPILFIPSPEVSARVCKVWGQQFHAHHLKLYHVFPEEERSFYSQEAEGLVLTIRVAESMNYEMLAKKVGIMSQIGLSCPRMPVAFDNR